MRKNIAQVIDAEDLKNYLDRKVSSAALAEKYKVTRPHLVRTLPKRGKGIRPAKAELRKVRTEFRNTLALAVLERKLTVDQAAMKANCGVRTMYRHLEKVRKDHGPARHPAAPAEDAQAASTQTCDHPVQC